MTRRSLERTRQLLLDVGLEMLHERGVDVGVHHVRLSEVVEAAGMTTGAAYRCWDNQDVFHRELAGAAIGWRDQTSIAATVAGIRSLVDAGAPLAEVIRVGAEANLHRYPDDAGFLITIALRAAAPRASALAEAGRQRSADSLLAYAELYAALLNVSRRRIRPPFTLEQMTMALASLSEGFALQAISGEPHVRVEFGDRAPGVGNDWTLFGCAVEGLVEWFTEPNPAAEVTCDEGTG